MSVVNVLFNEIKRHPLLSVTALLAFSWAVARAAVQSITIDEATTYELWVAPSEPVFWSGASNNHILNSILMRLSTSLFGVSHLTVRGPALVGAFLYISTAYVFCRLVTNSRMRQWTIFICLVGNPFVFDYLVAARGYGLATAMLLGALVVAAYGQWSSAQGNEFSPLLYCAWSSVLGALCIAANFSFAIAAIMGVVMTAFWYCRNLRLEASGGQAVRRYLPVCLACILPGSAVCLLLTSYAVLNWPAGQLWWGAASLRETARTLIESSLYQPNPYVINPIISSFMQGVRPVLLPLLGAATMIKLLLMAWESRRTRDSLSRWRTGFIQVLFGTLASTVLLHWLAFKLFHVLLPRESTALYVVVLATGIVCLIAAEQLNSRGGRIGNYFMTTMLMFTALYFLSCLRLNSFKEWNWDADVSRAYSVIARYSQMSGEHSIASSWHYAAVLNFYRVMRGDSEAIPEVAGGKPFPVDHAIYVLHYAFDKGFIDEHRLKILYRGESTELVVAVRPKAGTAVE